MVLVCLNILTQSIAVTDSMFNFDKFYHKKNKNFLGALTVILTTYLAV